MKSLRNRVQLIGNLGADPELSTFGDDKKKAKISLATNEFYRKSDGEKVEETTWHNLIAWGKTAQLAEQYLKKGSEVAIEGKLSHRKYEDKEGKDRYITEVVVNEFLMLDKKK
jgi:single-strand DNA-binding protein